MALSKPLVPVDESPLDRNTVRRILARTPAELILVGGQALGFWMERYGVGPAQDEGADANSKITVDADFLGPAEAGLALARTMNARYVFPDRRALTALVGQIRIPAPSGLEHNVDILHQLYDVGGLRAAIRFTARVARRAVRVELPEGIRFRVMHPLDVLASRIQNAAGLRASKGEHAVTQARWGIRVARVAIERVVEATERGGARPGALAHEVERLALSQAGRRLWRECGVEAAEAIPFDALLGHSGGLPRQARSMFAALQAHGRLAGRILE